MNNDLIILILSWLKGDELIQLNQICKQWTTIVLYLLPKTDLYQSMIELNVSLINKQIIVYGQQTSQQLTKKSVLFVDKRLTLKQLVVHVVMHMLPDYQIKHNHPKYFSSNFVRIASPVEDDTIAIPSTDEQLCNFFWFNAWGSRSIIVYEGSNMYHTKYKSCKSMGKDFYMIKQVKQNTKRISFFTDDSINQTWIVLNQ